MKDTGNNSATRFDFESMTMEDRIKKVEETIFELEQSLEIPTMEGSLRKLQIVSLESIRILTNMLRDVDGRLARVEGELAGIKSMMKG